MPPIVLERCEKRPRAAPASRGGHHRRNVVSLGDVEQLPVVAAGREVPLNLGIREADDFHCWHVGLRQPRLANLTRKDEESAAGLLRGQAAQDEPDHFSRVGFAADCGDDGFTCQRRAFNRKRWLRRHSAHPTCDNQLNDHDGLDTQDRRSTRTRHEPRAWTGSDPLPSRARPAIGIGPQFVRQTFNVPSVPNRFDTQPVSGQVDCAAANQSQRQFALASGFERQRREISVHTFTRS